MNGGNGVSTKEGITKKAVKATRTILVAKNVNSVWQIIFMVRAGERGWGVY